MSFKHNRHSAPPTENSHKKKNTSRGSIKDDTPKPSKKRVGSKLGPSATFSDTRTCRLGMKSEPSFVRETNPTQDVRRSVSNEADQPSPNPLDEPAKVRSGMFRLLYFGNNNVLLCSHSDFLLLYPRRIRRNWPPTCQSSERALPES